MIGMTPLIHMRQAGYRPSAVFVSDTDDVQRAQTWQRAPNLFNRCWHAHIAIQAQDIPEGLDFRPLVGLKVHLVDARTNGRLKRLYKAILAAQPAYVIAVIDDKVFLRGKPCK